MINDTIKILHLEAISEKIEDIFTEKIDNVLYHFVTLKKTTTHCIFCDSENITVHGYTKKKLAHTTNTVCQAFIIYKARRYRCSCCDSTFFEDNPFAQKHDKFTTLTTNLIVQDLRVFNITFKAIATRHNVSTTTVIRTFDNYVDIAAGSPTTAMCFDETMVNGKYAFVMVNFQTKQVIDVFPNRTKHYLAKVFSAYPKAKRDDVKLVCIDMWDTYRDLAYIYFKNASICVDSFHVIKNLNEALKKIRIAVMKKYHKVNCSLYCNDFYYYMLKKFHYFFTKNFENIYSGPIKIPKLNTAWDKHEILKHLLSIDEGLKIAYELKERYREFNLTAEYDTCDDQFDQLIACFRSNRFEEFRAFGRLLDNWKPYIKNSFLKFNNKRISNGPIEGVNSRIKTIIKCANGFTNFPRLRNKILFSLNKNMPILGVPKNK